VIQGLLNDSFILLNNFTSRGEIWHCKIRPSDGNDLGGWISSSTNVTIGNTPPSASDLDIIPSDPKTAQILQATYIYSDVDSDVEYGSIIRWYKNGIQQFDYDNQIVIPSHKTRKGENWYYTIQPSDGIEFGSLKTSPIVTIGNTPPSIENFLILPSDAKTGNDLLVNYTYIDADNDLESGTEIHWYKDGILQNSLTNFSIVDANYTLKGEIWHCKVKPSDGTDFGLWVNISTNITIGNTPPSINELIIIPSNPKTEDDLLVSYIFFDADLDLENDPKILWYNNGVLQGILNDSMSVSDDYTNNGEEWYCKVQPFDGTDFGDWINVLNNVTIGNTPPSVTNLVVNPSDPKTEDDLIATYIYFDPDGQPENGTIIRWYKNGLELPGFENQTVVSNSVTNKEENWYFTILPCDGDEYGNLKTSLIATIGNSAPSISSLIISPNKPFTNQSLSISYNFTDKDLDLESGTQIRWYKNGILQIFLNNSPTVDASDTTKGEEWYCVARPSDGTDFGLWINCINNITIKNAAPFITDLTISPSNPRTGDDLVVSYTYIDIDADPEVGSQIFWYKDGILQEIQIDSSTITANYTEYNQKWYCKVRSSDGYDYGELVSVSSNVTIMNTIPSAFNLNIIPNNPKTSNDLEAIYTYTDPDGHIENASIIKWYKNGLEQANYENQTIVQASATSKGENWYFTIQPNDGITFGSLYQSSPRTIENTMPLASALLITPEFPLTADDLRCSYNFIDDDSDVEVGTKIIWYKNGDLQEAFNDSITVISFYTSKGEEWHFKICPSDGANYGDWVSCPNNVTIGNTAPSVSNVLIFPSYSKTGDELSVNYNFIDADSDTESGSLITWYRNGILAGILNGSTTVESSFTSKGEEWLVKIQPFDGEDFGSWVVSENRTIVNTAPTVYNLMILPENPITHEALIVSYTFFDPDSDSENGSNILWYKNGIEQSVFENQILIPATATTKGENWYFTIQPRDGSEYGNLQQSSSITIRNTAPTAKNLSISPSSPQTIDSLTINYDFADNDTSDSESGSHITWYKNGILQSSLSDQLIVDSIYTTKGNEWHFKVRASDGIDYGEWVSCPYNITIINTPPSISDLIIQPSTAKTEDDLIVSYTYYDADNDPESQTEINWYKDGILQSLLSNQIIISSSSTSRGEEWHIKVQVFDGTNFSEWISPISNLTIANTPPIVLSVEINDNNESTQVANNTNLVLNYRYTDADGDLQYNNSREILWYKGGVLQENLNDYLIIGHGNTTIGDIWYVKVRIYDGADYSTYGISPSVSIGQPPNQVPIVFELSFSNLNSTTSDFLYINYTYFDADGDNESGSMYYWYRNGIHMNQYDGFRNLSATATSKGEEWHVKVLPRDGKDFGNLVSIPINITIANTAPSASALQILPLNPITGSDLIATYTYSDIDSDFESGSIIVWYKDGVMQSHLNGSLSVQTGNTSKGEKWIFEVRPRDGFDFGSWFSCLINTTIGNSVPIVNNLAVTPVYAKTSDDLTASYDYFDIDSDLENGSYIRWFRNGIEVLEFENLFTIPNINTRKGQTWYFILQPKDGSDYGNERTSTAITIRNTAPSVSNVIIIPTYPLTNDILTANYSFSDLDDDSEAGTKIRWYKNGILQINRNNSINIPSSDTSKGEVWYYMVRPYDGLDFGSWVSCSTNISIENTAPSVSDLQITPMDSKTTNDLSVVYTFNDADNDAESGTKIIWYKNGVLQGVLNDSTTVSSSYTAKREEWHVKVQPCDDSDLGGWISSPSNITIGNTAPNVSILQINPVIPKTGNDLTANYIYSDADTDPENGSYIRWYRNGVLEPSLNDSFIVNSFFTKKDENWYFIIRPKDNQDYGNLKISPIVSVRNTAPEVSNLEITPFNPQTLYDLTLAYIYFDADEDLESGTEVRWYRDGVIQEALVNVTVPASYTQKGEIWHCKVRPFDGMDHGEWFSIILNATIMNTKPQIDKINIIPSSFATTLQPLVAEFNYSDVDLNDQLTFQITWIRNGVEFQQLENSTEVQSGYTHKGEQWYYQLKIFDGSEWSNLISLSTFIKNSIPKVDKVELLGGETSIDNIFVNYDFIDEDGDLESHNTTISWVIFRGGELVPWEDIPPVKNLSNSWILAGDFVYCWIKPHDGEEYGALIGSHTFINGSLLVGNSPPEILVPPIILNENNEQNFTEQTDIYVNYSVFDIDKEENNDNFGCDFTRTGQVVGTEYHWYKNGEYQSDLHDYNVPQSKLNKGDVWKVSIRPRDRIEFGNWINSSSIIIGNIGPTIHSFSWLPYQPTTVDNLSFLYVYEDAENDPEWKNKTFIQWFKNNELIIGVENTTILPNHYFMKNDNISVIIRPFDGINWAIAEYENDTTIRNAKPIAQNVTIAPSYFQGDFGIYLDWEYSDPDNDPESEKWKINWLKNGTDQTSFENLRFISATNFINGEKWEVILRIFDGFNYSQPEKTKIITKELTIECLFSPNSQVTQERKNEFYVEDENLSINFYFSTTNDSFGSRIQWFKQIENGSWTEMVLFENQTTIPYLSTAVGEQWKCLITPFDGTYVWSPINSSILTIESKPTIWTQPDNIVIVQHDTEGHYYFVINADDEKNNISEVKYFLNESFTGYANLNTSSEWVLDYFMTGSEFQDYLNTTIGGQVRVYSTVMYNGKEFQICNYLNFSFTVEDKAPPRVLNAFFRKNHETYPTNITFFAEVIDNGSDITSVLLNYTFRPYTEENSSAGTGSAIQQSKWRSIEMLLHNTTHNVSTYSITVLFKHNNTNWEIIYKINTTDSSGNTRLAYSSQDDPPLKNVITFIEPTFPFEIIIIIIFIILNLIGVLALIGNRQRKIYTKRSKAIQLGIEQQFNDIKSIRLLFARHKFGIQFYYEYTFRNAQTDIDMISGLSTALSAFMRDVTSKINGSKGRKTEFEVLGRKDFHMLIWNGTYSSFAIVTDKLPSQTFRKILQRIGKEVEKTYSKELENFVFPRQIPNNQVREIVHKHLPLYYCYPLALNEGVLHLKNIRLSKKEEIMLDLIKPQFRTGHKGGFILPEIIIGILKSRFKRSEAIKFIDTAIKYNLLIEIIPTDEIK
jgi:hypothetical protein